MSQYHKDLPMNEQVATKILIPYLVTSPTLDQRQLLTFSRAIDSSVPVL